MKISVYVKIGRQQGLLGWDGDRLIVVIAAPPIDGAANTRLIEVISDWAGVSKTLVVVTKGHSSRYKTLDIAITPELFTRLSRALPQLPRQATLL